MIFSLIADLFRSIKVKIIAFLLFFLVPLIFLLIYVNFYSIGLVRSQVADINSSYVSVYAEQVENILESTEQFMVQMVIQDNDLSALGLDKSEHSEYFFAQTRLTNKLSSEINNYPAVDSFFVYSKNNSDMFFTTLVKYPYETREIIKSNMLRIMSNQDGGDKTGIWHPLSMNDQHFFYRMIQTDTATLGSLISIDDLLEPLEQLDEERDLRVFITSNDYQSLSNEAYIMESNFDLEGYSDPYQLMGDKEEYLVVGKASEKGNFHLFTMVSDSEILDNLPFIQKIIWAITGITLISLIVFIFMLRRVILSPINRIIYAMKKLKQGDLGARIEKVSHKESKEFSIMHDAFNNMASEIQQLKIEVYEEQLKSQKAELKHLQLQVNPHFFLNSLNIINSLAQVKDFKLIKEMSQCLMEYFRFMFRSNKSSYVTLREELNHCENYLHIQQLRYPENLTYNIELVKGYNDCEVPPLLIQHFIENSIKHSVTTDKPIHILINVFVTEYVKNTSFLNIVIRDTGEGFTEEMLSKLNQGMEVNDEGESHIGIWNAFHRLRILNGDSATIKFVNGEDKGAIVKIKIPVQRNL
ncbi:sensor histidine kinase [Salipaludibacillus sp. CF4.18]|uniref:sensor histidine kinase n=1 Tax=Salipaludibacillus sp. CF4.18 TaxID=3373081 RepID=UPI003EE6858F